ncbi:MAG TPA: YdeI/OmpD-associated family protein [Gemmatimonadaceae bacterium]
MGTRDPRIDAYIAKSADFAQPILEHIRDVVHAACPTVEETMKWSFPHFMYNGMLCSMAAFKQHCSLGFWKGALLFDSARDREAMGQFGRITKIADLPPKKELMAYVKKAMKLNDEGAKVPRIRKPGLSRRAVPTEPPADLVAALEKNAKARATFEGFPPSHRREYIEWITEAKREETRQKRLAQTIEWLAEGKQRNWKYM